MLTQAGEMLADSIVTVVFDGRSKAATFAAGIYLASWVFGVIGRHAIRISKFTGLPRQFCVWCGLNMRHGGRWHDGVIDEWLNRDDGNCVFILDAMTASGEVSKLGHDFDTSRYKLNGCMPLKSPLR